MPVGKKIKMYYDPRGNVIRTVNPDNSEQWVIYGKPNTLSSIAINNSWSFKNYAPTPWESYTYDADDLAPITNGTSYGHDFTPKSATVDALGRTVKTVDRLSQSSSDDLVMKQTYDIQGNVLTTVDSLNRIVFRHKYGLAKQLLWKNHLDSGISTAIADATGKPIEATDAKGARVFTGYDVISRPENVWAKDNSSESTTLRQVNIYAETLGLPIASSLNLLGQIYQAYDEAGLTQMGECDFKGNPLEKFKQVISDDELVNAGTNAYTVDWTGLDTSILDSTEYRTTVEYDALNRGIKLTLPADITTHRAIIEPVFNNAGALEKIKKDGTEYVKQIAYNAKGQQILAAWNNDVMIRFAYDKETFRLNRVKAEKYTYSQSGNAHTYAYNSGTTRYDQRYTYDLIGNVLGVSDQTPDCGLIGQPDQLSRLFEYDALYRLLQATGREENNVNNQYWTDPPQAGTPNATNCRAYTERYKYDKVGNIQNLIHTASGNNWTRHYNYQANNNKLNSIDDGQSTPTTIASFTYDNNGNQITTNSDRFYEWNYADRMRCFYIQAGMSISKFAHYLYDAGGQRTKKLVLNQSGGYDSVTYIDGVFEYHRKVTTSTTEEKNYIQVQGGIEIRVGGYSDDDSETTLYTISDYLSSAVIRLIPDGSLYDKEEFYPYGETSLRTFGKKRYRFTGKERDNESGLYYYGARYYCSGTTKFLSVDPKAGEYAHQSSYCYADCNPVVKNDPSGMNGDKQTGDTKSEGGGGNNNTTETTNVQNAQYSWSTPKPSPYSTKAPDDKSINTHGPQAENKPNQELQTNFSKEVWNQKALEAAPKEDVSNWSDLIGYKPNQALIGAANERVSPDKASLQNIEAAQGSLNVDFYSVTISQFPEGVTPEQFLENFRTNLNDFFAGGGSTFEAYNAGEGERFQSETPDGTLMRFSVFQGGFNVDNLSVMASNTNSAYWVFSPVTTSADWGHPVAGNRQFGITQNEDGTHTFYIRGADRTWSTVDKTFETTVFKGADQLWKAAINNAANYINNQGGNATIQSAFSKQIKR